MHVSGVLLPESIVYSTWFAVLSAFVAVNTLVYVTLAALKTLPVLRPRTWLPRRYERAETRSIHPDADEDGPRAARPDHRHRGEPDWLDAAPVELLDVGAPRERAARQPSAR